MASPKTPGINSKPTYLICLIGLLLLFFCYLLGIESASSVYAAPPEPPLPTAEPTSWLKSPRLKKPDLPTNPTMAENGAIPYWSICLSCHGDKGQGLTDEWREAGFGEDMNCWKSKCHAFNHPTPGFNFPRQVPPVIGINTLQRFTTAQELNTYIQTKMPWWDPGSLSESDSWNLTAYLLRENGVLSKTSQLDINNAGVTPVHLPIRSHTSENIAQYTLSALIGLAAFFLFGTIWLDQNQSSITVKVPNRPGFFHHLHPPSIPLPQARWRYTLGAGGIAVFLILVVSITGILEMFFYTPTPTQAGLSIQTITYLVPYGGLIRGLHFWAAQGLVVISGVHLLRVIFTGAFHAPRRFNFLLGLGLFVLILFMNFTGYILRWDNGIHWALLVGTNLLKTIPFFGDAIYRFVIGGEIPGMATLNRFYAWHIFGLTIFAIVFLGWHLFRVRRDGGISVQDPELRKDPRRISRYELVNREALAMLIAGTTLVVLATIIPPPIAAPIMDASMPLNPDVRAPWFFLWVQQLLRYGDAFWMGIAIPLGMLLTLAIMPYVLPPTSREQKGIWFPRTGRIAQIVISIFAICWLFLTILELIK